jgi:hypothetical protein
VLFHTTALTFFEAAGLQIRESEKEKADAKGAPAFFFGGD